MWRLLYKLFVRSFYQANAGFFLFFFFVFFGAVQGGSLVSYHLSLMQGMFDSAIILGLVLLCWLLYQLKCTAYFLKIINSDEGKFLHALQAINSKRQWLIIASLYLSTYAPVLLYSLLLALVGLHKGYTIPAIIIGLFQFITLFMATAIIYNRLNSWLKETWSFGLNLPFPHTMLFLVSRYFLSEKRTLFLLLKILSLTLFYIILVLNVTQYDNGAFLLFYLVMLLAHAILPYLAIQFTETQLAIYRNLPVSLVKRALAFIIAYSIILLPEGLYIFCLAGKFPMEARVAYYLNAVTSLFLLTSLQYSESPGREDYMKATFGLFFISIFALHIQAFYPWILIQLVISVILFRTGFYSFSLPSSPEKHVD